MVVLVTGGAGFVGSHLTDMLLEQGVRVVCVDDFNDYYDPRLKRSNVERWPSDGQVTLVEADICDGPAMDRVLAEHAVTHVVHLAAYAGVHASVQNPLRYQRVNVGGTLSLLEAVRRRPLERFLLVSSSTVYGTGAAVPFREDAPPGIPASPYGATKRAAELLGLTYHQLHQTPVVCLRPFSVFGPRIRPDLAMSVFARAISRGEPIPLYGDGTIRRDFTYVSDICRGLLAALSAEGAVGQCINLGHNEPVTIRELIDQLAGALGRPAHIDFRPTRPEDLAVTCADLSQAAAVLDYAPTVSLAAGVAQFVRWFRQWYGES